MRKLCWMILLCLLSSCSLFAPVDFVENQTYIFAPHRVSIAKQASKSAITILPIQASPGYDSERMAYTEKPYEIKYFAKNEWVAAPANLLQAVVTKRLRDTGYRIVSQGNAEKTLKIHLNYLQQDFITRPSKIRLSLDVTLSSDSKPPHQRHFEYVIPANEDAPYGGVVAANRAISHFLIDLIKFIA